MDRWFCAKAIRADGHRTMPANSGGRWKKARLNLKLLQALVQVLLPLFELRFWRRWP